jgi:hypothetical protein
VPTPSFYLSYRFSKAQIRRNLNLANYLGHVGVEEVPVLIDGSVQIRVFLKRVVVLSLDPT